MTVRSVYCLCAAWCDTCTTFRAAFEQAGAAHPAVRFEWIDIEDEASLVDDVDIETFPTILVLGGGSVMFCAPIRPQREHLEAVLANHHEAAAVAAPIAALGARLVEREQR
jgi:thioredoxin 1